MRRIMDFNRVGILSGLLAAFVGLAGCGGPENVGRVTGVVTLNGAPLPGAVVKFQPQPNGSPSAAVTDDSGRYTLRYTRDAEGAEIGEHLVSISTFSKGDPDAEPPRPAVPEQVPPHYNTQSSLTASVKAGSNQFDFQLDAKGPVVQPSADSAGRR